MTVVICGDTPLITAATLQETIELHQQSGAAATILTAKLDEPQGYGRIIRGEDGRVARIVEQKDCAPRKRQFRRLTRYVYF